MTSRDMKNCARESSDWSTNSGNIEITRRNLQGRSSKWSITSDRWKHALRSSKCRRGVQESRLLALVDPAIRQLALRRTSIECSSK